MNCYLNSCWLHRVLMSVPLTVWKKNLTKGKHKVHFIAQGRWKMETLSHHTVYGVLKAGILKWFAIPFSSGPHFVKTLHHDLSILDSPRAYGSKFHWVRQDCGPYDQFGQFSVIGLFILSTLWYIRIRGLWKLPDERDWLRGNWV